MASRYTGPAMDLANMRSLGNGPVDVACSCGRRASVDMSALPESVPVPSLKRRLCCPACAPDRRTFGPIGRNTRRAAKEHSSIPDRLLIVTTALWLLSSPCLVAGQPFLAAGFGNTSCGCDVMGFEVFDDHDVNGARTQRWIDLIRCRPS
jgi:hypothetical protein